MIGRNSVVRRTLDNLPESQDMIFEGGPDADLDFETPDDVENVPSEE